MPRTPARLARETSAFDLFVFTHGFRPSNPTPASLIFCMFLHSGFLHLAGNMLFLWIYGDNVERRLGLLRYLFWYLATGSVATLFHALWAHDSPIPLVGASGAISGILGFYFLWFPRNRVRVLWFLPPFLMQVFEIPARIVLGVYLVLDNLLPFVLAGATEGVAYGAHIGRFLAGLAMAWFTDRRRIDASPEDVPEAALTGGPGAVKAALAEGRLEDAAAAYFALPPSATRGLLGAPEAVALAKWLRAAGHPADAFALAGLILLDDRHEPAAAYQYLLTALELEPDPETAAEVRRGLLTINALQKRQIGRLYSPRRP